MLKCRVCGHEFEAKSENHYISRENGKIGFAAALCSTDEDVLYDSFDCPACGCQYVAQQRKRCYRHAKADDIKPQESNEEENREEDE